MPEYIDGSEKGGNLEVSKGSRKASQPKRGQQTEHVERGKGGDIRTQEVDDLLHVLAALDDPDTIFELLEDLFTIREIRETSQRLAVARLLDSGMSYAAIEEATGASATTIARVSKCLSYGSGGYRAALEILEG